MIKILLLIFITGVILILIIIMVIDARQIRGVKLNKMSENKWEVVLKENKFVLKYVPASKISPLFGVAFDTGYAMVRNDLPKRVQKFVSLHEIYHLYDFSKKLHKNRLSKEIHANLAAFFYEPLGGLQTLFLTIKNSERRHFYFYKKEVYIDITDD
jgi:hypothetical protein